MDLFDPCWRRIERADDHRRALSEIWNDHLDAHPYHFEILHEGAGIHVLRVREEHPLPAEFAMRLGEWLYNIRSCLDYVIWATAAYVTGAVPPPDEASLQYPIYESKPGWDRNTYRLNHLADHHRQMLWTMQPFNSDRDANYLGVINNLARIDRHRRPTDGTAYLAQIEPVVRIPAGTSVTFQWGQRMLTQGRADVARMTVTPWRDDMEVVVNPRIGIDPEVGEWARSPFWQRMRFSERLPMIQAFVKAEIAVYEYDVTGATRMADALTYSYKAECDGRERNGPPERGVEPWEWSSPVEAAPSTEARLRGDDFPQHGPGPASRPGRAAG